MKKTFQNLKTKIVEFKRRDSAMFVIVSVVIIYLLYKLISGLIGRFRMDQATKQARAENEALQKQNTASGVNDIRADICEGIAKSIKQCVEDWGFFEKWFFFDPTKYITDMNRLNGVSEAIYISNFYKKITNSSLKADLQKIAYNDAVPFSSITAKGGRFVDIKAEIRNALF